MTQMPLMTRLVGWLAATAVWLLPYGTATAGDSPTTTTSDEVVRLWDGTAERAGGVKLTAYRAAPGAAAVIICPGGSYSWLSRETEGHGVARWLQAQGVTAFVLEYRVQGVASFVTHYRIVWRGHRHPDPLRDVQRAILYCRRHAAAYGIDPTRLGVMGFSAGGHLAMAAGAYHATNFIADVDSAPEVSLRPDFVAAIYPVVTMSARGVVHRRSRRALLGEWGQWREALRDSLSLERHIGADTPPTFLVNSVDDPTVDYRNSVLLDSALEAAGVPHHYEQYRTGGHGFGADEHKMTAECGAWREAFLQWLHNLPAL